MGRDLGRLGGPSARSDGGIPDVTRIQDDVRSAERISARLKVPVDCRDAARLAARWHRIVPEAQSQAPATVLDLLNAADALRRPERVEALLQVCECDAMSTNGPTDDFAAASHLREALKIVKGVDAGAIARVASGKSGVSRSDAITAAIRAKRLSALRAWKRASVVPIQTSKLR